MRTLSAAAQAPTPSLALLAHAATSARSADPPSVGIWNRASELASPCGEGMLTRTQHQAQSSLDRNTEAYS